jgi:hypothetical protein
MTTPQRIQQQRTKGWREPDGAISVARPHKWGNPYEVDEYGHDLAVQLYRWLIWLPELEVYRQAVRDQLRGRDLMCFCELDQRCHADVLLELANTSP